MIIRWLSRRRSILYLFLFVLLDMVTSLVFAVGSAFLADQVFSFFEKIGSNDPAWRLFETGDGFGFLAEISFIIPAALTSIFTSIWLYIYVLGWIVGGLISLVGRAVFGGRRLNATAVGCGLICVFGWPLVLLA